MHYRLSSRKLHGVASDSLPGIDRKALIVRLRVSPSPMMESLRARRVDVVLFQQPGGGQYLKRVIGAVGDRIAVRNRTVCINGEAMEEPAGRR
jgi:hypothetical protein